MATTGQAIREALNARISTSQGRIRQGFESDPRAAVAMAERVDELALFRIELNRILSEAGEL